MWRSIKVEVGTELGIDLETIVSYLNFSGFYTERFLGDPSSIGRYSMWYWPGDNNCVISEFLRLRTQKGFSAVYSWTIKHPYIRSVVGWSIAYHHRGIFTSGCTGVYIRRIWGFLLCYIYYILATHLTSSISSLNMSIRKSTHRMPNFLFLSASFDMDSNAARRTSKEWTCVRTYIHMCGCMHTRMHIYVLYICMCGTFKNGCARL